MKIPQLGRIANCKGSACLVLAMASFATDDDCIIRQAPADGQGAVGSRCEHGDKLRLVCLAQNGSQQALPYRPRQIHNMSTAAATAAK